MNMYVIRRFIAMCKNFSSTRVYQCSNIRKKKEEMQFLKLGDDAMSPYKGDPSECATGCIYIVSDLFASGFLHFLILSTSLSRYSFQRFCSLKAL